MEENKNIENNNQNSTPNVATNNQNLMPVKKNNGIVIGLIVIIILLAVGLVYVLFFTKDDGKEELKPQVTTTPEPVEPVSPTDTTPIPQATEEPNNTGNENLVVYLAKWGKYGQFFDSYTEDAEKISIKVDSPNAKFITSDNDSMGNYFLYDDNGIKLYDYSNKKSISIDIGRDYKNYRLNMSSDYKSVVGISYYDDNFMATYYNLKTNKEMYKNKYKVKEDTTFSNIDDHHLSVVTDTVSYLVSSDTEKEYLSYHSQNDDYTLSYGSYNSEGKYIYSLQQCYDDCVIKKLYNDQMKEFYSGDIDASTSLSIYNDSLYIYENNEIKKYNLDGELQKTKEYKDVRNIVRDYVIYVNNNKLVLENFNDSSEFKELTSMKENWYVDSYDTGYYTRDDLDALDEKNKKEGLYVVIEYSDKDSNGNYGMEYCYTPDKQIIEYPIKEMMGGRAKPVLYLYPEKETNVTVKFEKPELLTTTYPKYVNSWNVTVKPNGDMKDKDGKYYYALYWDEKRYNEVDFKEGFYVESKDAISFLEEKLSIIGLSDKERNEFIMYWLPIMENNGKNLVYFELTKERELGNKLIIEPKPDSLLRVSIHIKKVNEKTNIKEQKLETFKRIGFTAVEWGGMTY